MARNVLCFRDILNDATDETKAGEGGKGRLRASARILLITAGRMPALPGSALPARDVIVGITGNRTRIKTNKGRIVLKARNLYSYDC